MRVRLALAVLMVVIGTYAEGQSAQPSSQQRDEYARWTARYRKQPLRARPGAPDSVKYLDREVWFEIYSVECEPESQAGASTKTKPCRLPLNMCQVSYTGVEACQFTTCCPGVGGGGGPMKPSDFRELEPLLANLPDDFEKLPAPGQRLLIQFVQLGGERGIRVYDERNLPDSVKKLVDLLRIHILNQDDATGR